MKDGAARRVVLDAGGRERWALVLDPDPEAASEPGATVVLLHGGGVDARGMAVQSRAEALARRHGWRVVLPQGVDRLWRPTRRRGLAHRADVDDLGFLDALVDAEGSGPVVVGGFSNGAMMAYRYAAERPQRAALVLAVGGVPLELPDGPEGPAVLHVHGDADRRVPWSGGRELPPVDAQLERLARRRGLRWTTLRRDPWLVRRATDPSRADGGAWIDLHVVAGLGHAWPRGVRLSGVADDHDRGPDVGELLAAALERSTARRHDPADVEGLRRLVVQGDPEAVARRHRAGRLTARERIDELVDPGSFVELDLFRRRLVPAGGLDARAPHTDGVVCGFGSIDDRQVVIASQDVTVLGGSLGAAFASKVAKAMDLARDALVPIVTINDGGGARIQEGVDALAGFGELFARHVALRGVVPQISLVLGSCAGGAAYSPALCDVVVMARRGAHVYLTGPDVVRRAVGEQVTHEALGGADVHARHSGLCTLVGEDDADCLAIARDLLAFLPDHAGAPAPLISTTDPHDRPCVAAAAAVPATDREAYDVRLVVRDVLDRDGDFLELSQSWAPNLVCGLGHLGGRPVGVVANQPAHLAGALDAAASTKGAGFVRLCDRFGLPVVTFVDVPGFLPGVQQERSGVIRAGADLLSAYAAATVPRLTVVLRKAYGGAFIVMGSRSIGADLALAWPGNEVAVLGADAAVAVLHRRELAGWGDAELAAAADRVRAALHHPLAAAERGHVDDVIAPEDTRRLLVRGLDLLDRRNR